MAVNERLQRHGWGRGSEDQTIVQPCQHAEGDALVERFVFPSASSLHAAAATMLNPGDTRDAKCRSSVGDSEVQQNQGNWRMRNGQGNTKPHQTQERFRLP
jgi:hypothetical protein